VQHKRIGVPTEFGNDEGHTLRHQTGHKSHVTRKPVESLATATLHFAAFAAASAAASCGRLSRASAPLPVSASTTQPQQ